MKLANIAIFREGAIVRRLLVFAAGAALVSSFARAAEKSYVGATGGDWFTAANWSPEGVPTAADDVTINAKTVNAVGDLVAGSVSLSGAATLNIGNSATRAKVMADPPVRTNVSATITGDLTLSGASKLYVFSGRLADTNMFDGANARGQAYTNAIAALWAGANRISIGGAFSVDGNSFVYPDFEPITGTPVVFTCGSFFLGEGSTVSTVLRGWDWSNGAWATHPAGALPRYAEGSSMQDYGWTYSFAPARSYQIGGGYGGDGQLAGTYNGYLYGRAYGYSFAPFLSGSPSSAYRPSGNDNNDDCRGSSAFVVYAADSLTVNGTIDAYGYDSRDYSGASGGGIWLATGDDEVSFGPAATLNAYGAAGTYRGNSSWSYNSNGGGGRIAVAQGVSQAEWSTLASGALPTGFKESAEIIGPTINLAPGSNGQVSTPLAQSGTASLVQSDNADVFMNVALAGEGSVTYAGTTYTTNFLVKVPVNTAITLTALNAGNSTFVAWHGENVPGGESLSPTISLTATEMFSVTATFVSTTRTTRTWNGSLSDSWRNGGNWTPAGAPGTNDDLVFSACAVSLPQGTNSFGSVTLTSGATMRIGNSTTRPSGAVLATARDLTVQGASTLYVYAPELADLSVFASATVDPSPLYPVLWNAASVVTVGGDLVVSGTDSKIISDAAPKTGVPVVFRVGGDLEVGAGATVDGKNRGWMWVDGATAEAPAGYKPRRGNNALKNNGWTFAPGAGLDYYYGGAYGGYASHNGQPFSFQNCNYSAPYGYAIAPFLPGSPAGWYRGWGTDGKSDVNQTKYQPSEFRAGGQVVLLAGGEARIDGTITAACDKRDYAGSSGGGIWLAATNFVFGASALLDVHGGDKNPYSSPYCPGSGGRIALSEGMTPAQLDACAAGVLPAGFADWGAPDGVDCNVKCGVMVAGSTRDEHFVDDGTVAWLRSVPVTLSVRIEGAGSVAVAGGESYTTNFALTVAAGSTLTMTATPEVRFSYWSGDVPGGTNSYSQTLTLDVVRNGMVLVADMPVGPFPRIWTGNAGDGNVLNPANWDPAGYPITVGDALVFNSGTATITNGFTAHSLTVTNSAKVTLRAAPTDGPCDPASLYAAATVVTLPGGLFVQGSSTLSVETDMKTGAAVRFDVDDFTVGKDATVSAKKLGWGWFDGDDSRSIWTNTVAGVDYKTIAPGAGNQYYVGGGYGANGGHNPGFESSSGGSEYGYALAPFLPGSPNGVYNEFKNTSRGGGVVWIRASGTASIDGRINADGGMAGNEIYGSSSGGGVWIAAGAVKRSKTGLVTAEGGGLIYYEYKSSGTGGRIAVAVGLSAAEYAALAAGGTPSGVTVDESIDLFGASVLGGQTTQPVNGYRYRSPSGTLRTAYGSDERRVVVVSGAGGVFADGVEPAYGAYSFAEGEELPLFAAPEYGVDPQNALRRYAADGYEIRDASGVVVASGDGRSASIPASEGPLFLYWKWASPESRLSVSCPANAALRLDGAAVEGDIDVWVADGSGHTIEVVADEGYEFLGWTRQIPLGSAFANPATVTADGGRAIGAITRTYAAPTTRRWVGANPAQSWTTPGNWSPAGLPGHEDTIRVTADQGDMLLTCSLRVAALNLSGKSIQTSLQRGDELELSVTGDFTATGGSATLGTQDVGAHIRLSVGGDLTMSGNATLTVYAGPTGGDFDFAGGCAFVDVGGTFELAGTASFAPVSQRTDGGSVKTTCHRFVLGENAKVNATGRGYGWVNGVTKPDSVGTGWDFLIGGAYAATEVFPPDVQTSGRVARSDLEWFHAYGYRLAPIHPGSPNGNYQSDDTHTARGGGLVRIHASEMSIAGQILANAGTPTFGGILFGGASGGGIWLTADAFDFAATAVLSVKGGNTGYASPGGGGRIAIGEKMCPEYIERLAATGECPGLRNSARRQNSRALANFAARHPGVTVVLDSGMDKNGATIDGDVGSFEFYMPKGSIVIVW